MFDFKRILSAALAAFLAVADPSATAYAAASAASRINIRRDAEYYDRLNKNITAAMDRLEDVLQKDYDEALAETKRRIEVNDWDFEYTMDSFYNDGVPFSRMDYPAFIAAYATIVELGTGNRGPLSNVPFLRTDFNGHANPEGVGKYGEITFTVMSEADLFSFYGYDMEDPNVKTRYTDRLSRIREAVEGVNLAETVFITTPEKVKSPETDFTRYIQMVPSGLGESSQDRYDIVATALSLLGAVPYDWGGKPSKGGYDTRWWSYNEDTKRQRGLDCSGFVQWVFMTLGYPSEITSKISYTGDILDNLESIQKEELRPGDIGLKNDTKDGVNHTGIYIGNDLWVHCSSSGGTVVVNGGSFRFYKRAPLTTAEKTPVNGDFLLNKSFRKAQYRHVDEVLGFSTPDEDDVLLFAQLISHEAEGEGYNGWVAAGEVVVNRVASSYFPNTLSEVIFQRNEKYEQFTKAAEIVYITPKPEIMSVARQILAGKLRYFNNHNVLYFRNPTRTSGLDPSDPVDWGNFKYYGYVAHHAFYTEEPPEG